MTAMQTHGTEAGLTSIAVVIVAAGRGSRMGGPVPKQYLTLGGIPILRRTLSLFLDDARIGCVRTVIHPDDDTLYREAVAGIDSAKLRTPVGGGDTRAASVHRGLQSLADGAPDLVLVHDAARPFTPRHVIDGVIDALDEGPVPAPHCGSWMRFGGRRMMPPRLLFRATGSGARRPRKGFVSMRSCGP